ncbi:tail terminator protein [Stenotrophomonas phage BUCT627]|uniref:Tail terminator protein n=2 Tax=Bixiavirus TaxID=3044676 RepID=A0A7D2LNN6_9CAUD|nr:tail terminator [Stenotrophomonas phage vB_SmaS_BUCT548]YP_010677485.1 tail terminator [Stenotrophomonas phage BUCT627]QIQ60744.1 tail terminator protein [Stenotrophomonas phage vB_SmaS_BUCT548]QYC96685.1 tail terminator protein [Stenotrophomonas phage BUCT627]
MNAQEAKDEMLGLLMEAWGPTGYKVVFDDLQESIPAGNEPWLKVTIRHMDGGTTSLTGAHGVRRYEAVGYLMAQVRVPSGRGFVEAYALADKLLAAFTKINTENCVGYSNQRIMEVGSDSTFAQANFITDFMYESAR